MFNMGKKYAFDTTTTFKIKTKFGRRRIAHKGQNNCFILFGKMEEELGNCGGFGVEV